MNAMNSSFSNRLRQTTAVLIAVVLSGCVESSFLLAEDSKVPEILALPPGVSRDQVTVRLNYYATRKAVLQLKIDGESRLQIEGELISRDSFRLRDEMYPAYEFLLADGKLTCLEHRAMEPRFYVCDKTPAMFKIPSLEPSG